MAPTSLFDFKITKPDALLPEGCAYRGTNMAATAAQLLVTAAVEVSADRFETPQGAASFKQRVRLGQFRIPEHVHRDYCPEFGE